jgi:hypothetical protein
MKLSKSFPVVLFFAFVLTYLVHESGHWLVGAWFGFDMKFSLNSVTVLSPALPWQKGMMDAAGPVLTILGGCIALVYVMRRNSHTAFAFLYVAAFMRAVAGLISFFMPNDEARLSVLLGLPMWVLPTLVAAFLIALVIKGSRHLRLTWKDHLLCYVMASLASAAIVGFDRFVLK